LLELIEIIFITLNPIFDKELRINKSL
jgi:hypothetical protein